MGHIVHIPMVSAQPIFRGGGAAQTA